MHIFTLAGPLTFDNVLLINEQGKKDLLEDNDVTVDLKDITVSDSAGLALLIKWKREAIKQNKKIHFSHVPLQLLSLAKVSGVEKFLANNS